MKGLLTDVQLIAYDSNYIFKDRERERAELEIFHIKIKAQVHQYEQYSIFK